MPGSRSMNSGPTHRTVASPLVAGLAAASLLLIAARGEAADATTMQATYVITVGGVVVGHAQAETKFTDSGYVAEITGATSGLTRLATDARASLSGRGSIVGSQVVPSSYNLETVEEGLKTHVSMAMRAGAVTDLVAVPQLKRARDRVPVTPADIVGVVDPLSAFLIPLEGAGPASGQQVCDRTVKVFDGWTRFDIKLNYKETKAVDGSSQTYAGLVFVCSARYIPVAGHRSKRETVRQMADNDRLELWLVPVKDKPFVVPYRILIGTSIGDLVVYATRFSATSPERHAEAE